VPEARQLAAARRDGCPAIALQLAVSTWTDTEARDTSELTSKSGETGAAAAVLQSAGWRVASVDASTPLAVAWQRLPRFAGVPGLAG